MLYLSIKVQFHFFHIMPSAVTSAKKNIQIDRNLIKEINTTMTQMNNTALAKTVQFRAIQIDAKSVFI